MKKIRKDKKEIYILQEERIFGIGNLRSEMDIRKTRIKKEKERHVDR